MTKDLQLKIRIDDTDKRRLSELAAHLEVSEADIVRMLLKREHERVFKKRRTRP